jgi:hypothetical protein
MEVTQALSISKTPLLALSQPSSVPPQQNEPDYSLWTAQKYTLWLGFTTFHDTVAEENPWWQFGYTPTNLKTGRRSYCY